MIQNLYIFSFFVGQIFYFFMNRFIFHLIHKWMRKNMTLEPTKKGKEIEKHLSTLNMDPWFYIYHRYIKRKSKKESNEEIS